MVLEEWKNQYAVLVTSSTTNTEKPEDLLVRVWKAGGEGVILKDLNGRYGDEKSWVKVKKQLTEDVVIVGYDDPEDQTEKTESYVEDGIKKKRVLEVSQSRLSANGWIGAIRFGQYKKLTPEELHQTRKFFAPPLIDNFMKDGDYYSLTYCGSCSGMEDATRKLISDNKAKLLGEVVEILANDREETGKFRHPRMIDFRNNKNAKDCIWGQK
jgi:ATP-dependent DNA ligase